MIDYEYEAFDLNYRCEAVALYQKLKENKGDISFPKRCIQAWRAVTVSLVLMQ